MIGSRLLCLALIALAFPSSGTAQSIKLPAEIKGQPGLPVLIAPEVDGGNVVWFQPDLGLVLIDSTFFGGTSKNVIGFGPVGRYRLWAATAKGDKVAKAETVIVIGDAPVPPGPTPGPTPGPGPKPPDPPTPAPIPGDGFRVLFYFPDKANLTQQQVSALGSTKVRTWLNAHCIKGPDGKTPEWRIWDASVASQGIENESKTWQDAFRKATATTKPWIMVSTGKDGFEGSLPADEAGIMAILTKWGGN